MLNIFVETDAAFMISIWFWLTAFILVLSPFFAFAQNFQGWAIYFGNTSLKNSRFSIHQELQLRDYQLLGDHQQTLLRVGLQYRASAAVNYTLGYGYIYTEQAGEPNRPFSENRIYQEASIRHRWDVFRFRHRFRTEERFLKDTFRGRGRYCLFVDIPITKREMGKAGWYIALYDEVFLNVFANNADTFDRNRLYSGIGYRVSESLGFQLGYMRQHVGTARGTDHLMFSIHHQLKR